MAHRRQWRAAALYGGAPTSTGHGCARGELLHDQEVMVEQLKPQTRRSSGRRGVATCGALRRWRWTPRAAVFPGDESTTGGNISPGHGSRSRTRNTLTRREKGRANIEREGSPAMVAKAEHAPRWSHSEELTSVEVELMGAPHSTLHGGAGTRWMQLGGARCRAGHGGGVRSAVLRRWWWWQSSNYGHCRPQLDQWSHAWDRGRDGEVVCGRNLMVMLRWPS
jgi:hypothetical protein